MLTAKQIFAVAKLMDQTTPHPDDEPRGPVLCWREAKWSREKPKRPGWYWCRNNGDRPDELWEAPVRIDMSTSGLICSWLTAPGKAAQLDEAQWAETCEWIGPIAPAPTVARNGADGRGTDGRAR